MVARRQTSEIAEMNRSSYVRDLRVCLLPSLRGSLFAPAEMSGFARENGKTPMRQGEKDLISMRDLEIDWRSEESQNLMPRAERAAAEIAACIAVPAQAALSSCAEKGNAGQYSSAELAVLFCDCAAA